MILGDQSLKKLLLGCLVLSCWLCAGGCSSSSTSVQLTVISPHRDEIRQEVALAFKDWFRDRTRDRANAAQAALQTWQAAQTLTNSQSAQKAIDSLLEDWRDDELVELREAEQHWQREAKVPQCESVQSALRALAEQPPPVDIVWQDIGGGTSSIVRYVRSRYDNNAKGIGIDLLYGGGTDNFLRFADEGYLERIEIPKVILERIRPDLNGVPLYDPGHRWYGPMLSSFGILCNRRVLERIGQAEPQTWSDLGKPEMQSWVSAGDPRMSGSVHMVYEIVLQRQQGWDDGIRLLLRLGANTHSFIRDSGTLTRTVIIGEVAAAGNLDANALSAVGRDPQMMSFQLPPKATIINPDAIAVLRGAPRKQLATAFVEFTLSDAGQQVIFLRPGQPGGPRRYPLCRLSVVEQMYERYPPDQRSTGATNPFAMAGTIRYDSRLGNRRWDALNDLFGAWIIDAHPDLVAAWRSVLYNPLTEAERRRLEMELFAPPCSEADLEVYARAITEGNPRTRTLTVTRWGEEARERYRRIRHEAESIQK